MRRDNFTRLKEQRNEALASCHQLITEAEREARDLTEAEARDFDQREREARALTLQIESADVEPATGGSPQYLTPGQDGAGELEDAIRDVQKGETRALSTAVSLSPGKLDNTLFDRLRAASVVLESGVRTLRTEGDSVTYPTLTADASPAWTAEAAPITPSDPTFSSVVATPRKLAALVQVSNEVLDDSDPDLTGVLTDHLTKVLALKLDAGILEGTGTPPEPTGFKNVAGTQTVAAAANGQAPTFDNFADAIALLEAVNVPRNRMRIVAHPRNAATLRKAKASTAGSYLWQDVGDQGPGTIFGVPLSTTPQLATDETQGTSGAVTNSAYVYDIDNVVFVWRSPVEIEVDRSRLFNSDQSEVRAKLRGDLIVPSPNALVRVTGFTA